VFPYLLAPTMGFPYSGQICRILALEARQHVCLLARLSSRSIQFTLKFFLFQSHRFLIHPAKLAPLAQNNNLIYLLRLGLLITPRGYLPGSVLNTVQRTENIFQHSDWSNRVQIRTRSEFLVWMRLVSTSCKLKRRAGPKTDPNAV